MSEPRKRLVWGLVIASVLLIAGGAIVFVLGAVKERVTEENYERIKAGMTEKEVETILGRPADECFERSVLILKYWVGGQGAVWISFSTEGKVSEKSYEPGTHHEAFTVSPPTAWEKLRMRFGWKRPQITPTNP